MNPKHLSIPLGLLLAGITPLAAAPSASPSEGRSVPTAVLPLAVEGVSESEARQVGDALATALQNSGRVRMLERSRIDEILAEQGFQQSGACDQGECAVEAGRLLGVEQLVVGTLGRVGTSVQISARRIDVGTGEILASSTRKGPLPLDRVLSPLVELVEQDLLEGGGPAGDARPEGSRRWLWWAGGGAALAGAATAYVLLREDEASGSGSTQTSPVPDADLQVVLP
ncbi:MAG: hypothetical protein H6686_08360 [Fibrobacteria bacterium]|nr:hypothetical protein [Fibrobacteria bacterium]